mmetsp:Transcript_3891/g.9024  ORF Transcript_3891/g.9024 Transcript_3891/m.9024 type:complete len:201 (-) Transcript_3891:964-1566(-)
MAFPRSLSKVSSTAVLCSAASALISNLNGLGAGTGTGVALRSLTACMKPWLSPGLKLAPPVAFLGSMVWLSSWTPAGPVRSKRSLSSSLSLSNAVTVRSRSTSAECLFGMLTRSLRSDLLLSVPLSCLPPSSCRVGGLSGSGDLPSVSPYLPVCSKMGWGWSGGAVGLGSGAGGIVGGGLASTPLSENPAGEMGGLHGSA